MLAEEINSKVNAAAKTTISGRSSVGFEKIFFFIKKVNRALQSSIAVIEINHRSEAAKVCVGTTALNMNGSTNKIKRKLRGLLRVFMSRIVIRVLRFTGKAR